MPLYDATGLGPAPIVAIPSQPAYFFGSFPRDTQDTKMRVTNVSVASNVGSVTGTIFQGNISAVGNQISIIGTQTNSGIFNVTAAVITGVTGTPSTGVYTITFALTNSDVAPTADSGLAIIPIAEVPEACANGTSCAIYVPSNELRDLGQKSITVATTFPSLPTAAVVTLYTAINNNPWAASPEWTSMGVVGTVAGGMVTIPSGGALQTFTTPAGRFFRVVVSGVSGGTLPTLVCKMVC